VYIILSLYKTHLRDVLIGLERTCGSCCALRTYPNHSGSQ